MPPPQTIRPCPTSSPCVDPSVPLTNFSSEAPDPVDYISTRFPWIDSNNPVGGDPGQNQPPNVWQADGCKSVCTSTVSQLAADICAAAQAFLCSHTNDNTIFYNDTAGCTVKCPDGSPFTFIVAAGLIPAASKSAANSQAEAFACEGARTYVFCLSDILNEICVGSKYNATITISKGHGPFVFSLIGSLPDGLTVVQSGNTFVISGTTTASGLFSFLVKATDPLGNFMQKPYSICVVDINQSSLPDATIGVAYTAQLTATACTNPQQSWQVVAGSLPTGLTLNEQTGLITGTPTGPAGQTLFKVQFQDVAT